LIGLQLTEEQIDNLTLLEIEKMLELHSKSLHDFKCMPYPKDYVTAELGNRLIYDEHSYDTEVLKAEFEELFRLMTGYENIVQLLLFLEILNLL
jgi:hypothetical protein